MMRVGVIGGGQLAWMMADAARALDVQLVVQTPNPDDPAVAIAAETIFAPVDDAVATAQLATRCDVITFENEFVNLKALLSLAEQGVCFRPDLQVLAPLLDKYQQRCYLKQLGLPVPEFVALEEVGSRGAGGQGSRGDSGPPLGIRGKGGRGEQGGLGAPFGDRGGRGAGELGAPTEWGLGAAGGAGASYILTQLGFPVVLKARRHGYDGQGTFIVESLDALRQRLEVSASQHLGHQSLFLLEEFVPFERELAVIAARSTCGEIVTYPIVETQQEDQVCKRVLVPACLTSAIEAEIKAIAHTLLQSLQAVGVFGIELFLRSDGTVLVNEIAPRTHNSGHFSLDACKTSQFEQHLRAVCGLPLGDSSLYCERAVMVNLLGYEHSQDDYLAQRQQLRQIPQAHVYWYGKTQSRLGRKLGHVTILQGANSLDRGIAIAQIVESIWYGNK